MATNKDINRWFKRIATALNLSIHDIAQICALGGQEISPTRAKKWQMPPHHHEFRVMTEDDMDAFTYGLGKWLDEQDEYVEYETVQ